MRRRAPFLLVAPAVAALAIAAGCSGDDAGAIEAPAPRVDLIDDAVAAVEERAGAPQQFFEVAADLEGVRLFVAADDATSAEVWRYAAPDGAAGGSLDGPEPAGEASGHTFAAAAIDLDADHIFDRLRDELDDPVIVDFAIQGGPDGAVAYDATIASDEGGVLLVLLGPEGQIQSVQSS